MGLHSTFFNYGGHRADDSLPEEDQNDQPPQYWQKLFLLSSSSDQTWESQEYIIKIKSAELTQLFIPISLIYIYTHTELISAIYIYKVKNWFWLMLVHTCVAECVCHVGYICHGGHPQELRSCVKVEVDVLGSRL